MAFHCRRPSQAGSLTQSGCDQTANGPEFSFLGQLTGKCRPARALLRCDFNSSAVPKTRAAALVITCESTVRLRLRSRCYAIFFRNRNAQTTKVVSGSRYVRVGRTEGGRKLAGGVAKRNHRNEAGTFPPRRGTRDRTTALPSPAAGALERRQVFETADGPGIFRRPCRGVCPLYRKPVAMPPANFGSPSG